MVRSKIIITAGILILSTGKLKNKTPIKIYRNILKEVKRKFQIEPEIRTVEIFVGESIIASNVPKDCSCPIAAVKLLIAVDKYP